MEEDFHVQNFYLIFYIKLDKGFGRKKQVRIMAKCYQEYYQIFYEAKWQWWVKLEQNHQESLNVIFL